MLTQCRVFRVIVCDYWNFNP